MNITGSAAIESIKLRRRGIPFLAAGASLFTLLVTCLPSIETGVLDWPELFSSSQFIFNQVQFLILSFFTGLVFAGEFESDTFDTLAVSPVSFPVIILGKILVILGLLIITVFCTFGLILAAGAVLRCPNFSDLLLGRYLLSTLCTVLLHSAFIPFYIMTSLIGRKILYTSIAGMVMVAIAMIFLISDFGVFIPSCIPALLQFRILGLNAYSQFFGFTALPEPGFLPTFLIFIAMTAAPAAVTVILLKSRRCFGPAQ